MAYIILGQLTFWCEYGISQCFFLDFTDCHVILFFSDCGLIFRGPAAPELGTVFNSNLCDRIIDIGLPAKDRKQYLLVMTPQKTVLYTGQLYPGSEFPKKGHSSCRRLFKIGAPGFGFGTSDPG